MLHIQHLRSRREMTRKNRDQMCIKNYCNLDLVRSIIKHGEKLGVKHNHQRQIYKRLMRIDK